jgi:hypothetical protein
LQQQVLDEVSLARDELGRKPLDSEPCPARQVLRRYMREVRQAEALEVLKGEDSTIVAVVLAGQLVRLDDG